MGFNGSFGEEDLAAVVGREENVQRRGLDDCGLGLSGRGGFLHCRCRRGSRRGMSEPLRPGL